MKTPRPGPVTALDDLEHTKHAHEFVGAEHGEVPFSVILVHSAPGVGPRLHRHPYAETFVIRRGSAVFTIGEETVVGCAGQVLVVPAGEPHKFRTGPEGYEAIHIHANPTFVTEWLE